MHKAIEEAVQKFLEKSEKKPVRVISHHDTDGITAAAIMISTLKRLDRIFSLSISKQFPDNISIPKNEMLVFLDMGSSNLHNLSEFNDVFVIDHHEITSKKPDNVILINPHLFGEEQISASGLAYLFAKNIDKQNIDLANLAVIGMVGDMLEKNISKLSNLIIEDAEVTIKKGLLLYPSTRPIHKTLEFSSSMFIPGVTGNSRGVLEVLREVGIEKVNGEYKSLIELSEEENSKLITSILLRRIDKNNTEIIGNIYLVKMFNKLEDARELSAMINACSRLGFSEISLLICLGNRQARLKAEKIYADYKQHLIAALNFVSTNKIIGKNYVIVNAKDNIKDTIIGTVASIISVSSMYEEGTIIITMAYCDDKIKVSARIAGRNGRNVREILEAVTNKIGGECGGHAQAAGCYISKEKEEIFINCITKVLDVEVVKI